MTSGLSVKPEPVSTSVLRMTVQLWLRQSAASGYSPAVAAAFVRSLVGQECDKHERGET